MQPRFWERRSVHEIVRATGIYILIIASGIFILLPLSWMLTAALRGDGEIVFTIPVSWFPTESFHFENFWRVFTYEAFPLWRPTLNTVFLVTITTIGVVSSNTLVGYALARLKFPGKGILFSLVIATMLMPRVVMLVPSFLLFNQLGWYGTYLPLWVPSFFANSWYVFITRQYMLSFPRDLEDAARIDGCGVFGIFWRIILPLSKPVIVVMVVFNFLEVWNDFTHPLIYLNEAKKLTLAVALDYFRRSAFSSVSINTTNLVMSAALLSVIPVLVVYFVAQRHIIGGIANVGLKG